MSKKDKRKLLEKYKSTKVGKAQINRLNRLNIIGVLCIIYAIFIILTDLNKLNIGDIILIISMIIAGLIFLISSYVLRRKSLNNFAIKNK